MMRNRQCLLITVLIIGGFLLLIYEFNSMTITNTIFPFDESKFDELILYRNRPVDQRKIIVEPVYDAYCSNPCNYTTIPVDTFSYEFWMESRKSRTMSRAITMNQHRQIMLLFEKVDTLFRRNNLTYMLAYGSLIGSYRHHDVVPWDDDLDILLKASDKDKLIQVFKSVTDMQLVPFSHYLKIFITGTNRAGKKNWSWPFLDIYVYRENSSYISTYFDPGIPIELVYPLRLWPFGRLFLPVPKDIYGFLCTRYSKLDDECFKSDYNHIEERYQDQRVADCKPLHRVYPFADHECNKTHCMDHLLVDGVHIHTFVYAKLN